MKGKGKGKGKSKGKREEPRKGKGKSKGKSKGKFLAAIAVEYHDQGDATEGYWDDEGNWYEAEETAQSWEETYGDEDQWQEVQAEDEIEDQNTFDEYNEDYDYTDHPQEYSPDYDYDEEDDYDYSMTGDYDYDYDWYQQEETPQGKALVAAHRLTSPQDWQAAEWMNDTWPATEQEWSSEWTWNEETWDSNWNESDSAWDTYDDSWDATGSSWNDQWNESEWQDNAEQTDPNNSQGYFLVAAVKELQPGTSWEADDESYWITKDEEGWLYAEGWNENNQWEEGYVDEELNWLPDDYEEEDSSQQTPLNQNGSQTQP